MYGSFDRLTVSYGFYVSRALVSYFAIINFVIINDSLRHSGNLGVRIIDWKISSYFLGISQPCGRKPTIFKRIFKYLFNVLLNFYFPCEKVQTFGPTMVT